MSAPENVPEFIHGLPYFPGFSCSFVVVLNGHETIFSAMVRQSETFAERCSFWTEKNLINAEGRGMSTRCNNNFYLWAPCNLCLTHWMESTLKVVTCFSAQKIEIRDEC